MQLKITIITDKSSWINEYLSEMMHEFSKNKHSVALIHELADIPRGEVLFILSLSKIIPEKYLNLNNHNIVIHASKLPKGKGWSPATWQILGGKNVIPLTLFEAVSKVDSGVIYLQENMELDGTELLPEIHNKLGEITCTLCQKFVSQYPQIIKLGRLQTGKSTYYPRRTSTDSELNPKLSIVKLFNLLRVVDNEKYPAYFIHKGVKYTLKIYQADGG